MTHSWDDYLNSPELQEKVRAAYKKQTASDPPPKKPIIRTTTLMRQVEADLRAAFPEVDFDLSVPEWSTRRRGRRCIEIFWCGDPENAAVEAVTGKYNDHGVSLFANGHVPCERCGEPTHPTHGRAICVICEPDLWGCSGDEAQARAEHRLKAEAADDA